MYFSWITWPNPHTQEPKVADEDAIFANISLWILQEWEAELYSTVQRGTCTDLIAEDVVFRSPMP